MKKIIITVLIIVALLLVSVVAIPLFFKKNLIDATTTTINKQINAEVGFTDFRLSLFSNFPKVTLEIDNLLILGKNEFENDTLLSVGTAKATTTLSSLFKKSGIVIDEIVVDKPTLNLLVNDAGNENWDLTATASSQQKPVANSLSENADDVPLALQLNKIEIKNATFLYSDKPAKTDLAFHNIDFEISGKMYGTSTELVTTGRVGDFDLKYNNVKYISNVSLETKSVLNVDYETMKISIAENQLLVNKLALELTGNMEIPSDSIVFDMQVKTQKSDFKSFLALVPPSYEKYLKDIETTGTATVAGFFKGVYFDENYPAFALKMNIADGNFHYVGLPDKIKKIKADVDISKPQGDLNLTQIKVNDAHAEIKNNPVDFTLTLNNLVEDLWFDGAFVGKLNFDHLKDVLPLDSVNVAGVIDANLFAKGNYSAIENEQYDKIKSDGIVLLDNFVYDSPGLTKKIFVPEGRLDFSPGNIRLKAFKINVGESDFNLSGKISNYLNYFLNDGVLQGNLNLHSNYTNLNELFRLQVAEQKTNNPATGNSNNQPTEKHSDKPESLTFDIPENIDITFRSRINRVQFDRLPITDVNGLITAKSGKLILNGLNMKMLDGELNVNGSYKNSQQNQPFIDFGIGVLNFDIPTAYRSLSGFRSMLPGAGSSTGKFSSNIKINGRLTPEFKFIPASVNGKGSFSTKDLQIIDSKIFSQLKGILKAEKLRNVVVDDFKAHFTVVNGNMELRPFKTKVAGQETSVRAALNVENLIDMRMDFNVKRDAFGPDIQNILALIPGNEKIKVVPAGVIITGPVGKPKVEMDLSEAKKTIMNATKDDIKNTINKLGNDIMKLFK
jgi:uncharacterized protein involved in outer membrane biogenesis